MDIDDDDTSKKKKTNIFLQGVSSWRESRIMEKEQKIQDSIALIRQRNEDLERVRMEREEIYIWENVEMKHRNYKRLIEMREDNAHKTVKSDEDQLKLIRDHLEEGLSYKKRIIDKFVTWKHSASFYKSFEGHTGAVLSVKISHDSKYVLSSSSDATCRLWDASNGKCLFVLQGHTRDVKDCDFHPFLFTLRPVYGNQVSNAADRIKRRIGSNDIIPTLVTASVDATLRLWSTHDGKCRKILKGHIEAVTCVSFTKCGSKLLSSSEDLNIKSWSFPEGHCIFTYKGGHSSSITCISSSVNYLSSSSDYGDGSIILWDLNMPKFKEQTEVGVKIEWSFTSSLIKRFVIRDGLRSAFFKSRDDDDNDDDSIWNGEHSDDDDDDNINEEDEEVVNNRLNADIVREICDDVRSVNGIRLTVIQEEKSTNTYQVGCNVTIVIESSMDAIARWSISAYKKDTLFDISKPTSGDRVGKFSLCIPEGSKMLHGNQFICSCQKPNPVMSNANTVNQLVWPTLLRYHHIPENEKIGGQMMFSKLVFGWKCDYPMSTIIIRANISIASRRETVMLSHTLLQRPYKPGKTVSHKTGGTNSGSIKNDGKKTVFEEKHDLFISSLAAGDCESLETLMEKKAVMYYLGKKTVGSRLISLFLRVLSGRMIGHMSFQFDSNHTRSSVIMDASSVEDEVKDTEEVVSTRRCESKYEPWLNLMNDIERLKGRKIIQSDGISFGPADIQHLVMKFPEYYPNNNVNKRRAVHDADSIGNWINDLTMKALEEKQQESVVKRDMAVESSIDVKVTTSSSDRRLGNPNILETVSEQGQLDERRQSYEYIPGFERLADESKSTPQIAIKRNGMILYFRLGEWTKLAHKNNINCIQFSNSEFKIASCASDGLIRIWQVNSGRLIHELNYNDISWVNIESNSVTRLMKSNSLESIRNKQISVNCVCWSRNDEVLASGSDDNAIILWNMITFEPIQRLLGHTDAISCVRISFDMNMVASSSYDGIVKVWSMTPKPPSKCAPPVSLSSTCYTITIGFKSPPSFNLPLTAYECQYRVGLRGQWNEAMTESIPPNWTCKVIKSLVPSTCYQFRIRALSAMGCGDWSDASRLKHTTFGPPIRLERPIVVASSVDDCMIIHWSCKAKATYNMMIDDFIIEVDGGEFQPKRISNNDDDESVTVKPTTLPAGDMKRLSAVLNIGPNKTDNNDNIDDEVSTCSSYTSVLLNNIPSYMPPKIRITYLASTRFAEQMVTMISSMLIPQLTRLHTDNEMTARQLNNKFDAEDRPKEKQVSCHSSLAALQEVIERSQDCKETDVMACVVEMLKPGTEYRFRIIARNAAGDSEPSEFSYSIRMPCKRPDKPDASTIINVLASGMTIKWKTPNDNGSAIEGYRIKSIEDDVVFDVARKLVEFIFPDRIPGQIYTYSVLAYNFVGWSDWSLPTRRKRSWCSPPLSSNEPIILSVRSGSVILKLRFPSCNGMPIYCFQVQSLNMSHPNQKWSKEVSFIISEALSNASLSNSNILLLSNLRRHGDMETVNLSDLSLSIDVNFERLVCETEYMFRTRCVCKYNDKTMESVWSSSSERVRTSEPAIPSPCTNIKVSKLQNQDILMEWKCGDSNGVSITGYDIEVNDMTSGSVTVMNEFGDSLSKCIRGLFHGHSFKTRIRVC